VKIPQTHPDQHFNLHSAADLAIVFAGKFRVTEPTNRETQMDGKRG
jgi:hypothetical protein